MNENFCHILLVEDNPGDARLVEEYLRESPDLACELVRGDTMAAGLELLGRERFDLIMADLGLPDSQGIATFHRLTEAAPATPIIILTGLGDREVALASLREGAQDYITKNEMSPLSLGKAVRYALERWRSQQALKSSEEKFSKVFRHSPVWVVISALEDGTYLEVNDAFLNAVGYSRQEVLGQRSVALGIWASSAERQKVVSLITEQGSVSNLEAVRHTKDGRKIPTLYSGELLEIDGRQCLVSVSQDISAMKQAEAERLKIEQQLLQVQKLESLGVLAGGIAHDFNNMLMGILGNAELARMDLSPESPVSVYFEHIETAARRLADLTNQLLAYSGRGRFVVKAINLSSLVTELSSLLNTVISKQAQVRLNLEQNLPSVQVDVTQMRQVIMNLITNAADAIGDRSGRITIRTGRLKEGQREPPGDVGVGVLPDRACVLLEVEDTGVGMDPQTRARIFDPFFTTKMEGRGLGLAAVLGIVRRHEGVIRLTSTPDVGTRVRVVLPIAAGARVEAQAARDAPFHGRGRALVVDDEPLVRDVAASMLAHMGFDVVTAAGGAEALELFERQPAAFEIVLLDLTMPGLGGLETLQALRRIRADVRIVLCSGIAQTAPEEVDEEQIAGFLRKPFRADQLAEVLVAAFARPG